MRGRGQIVELFAEKFSSINGGNIYQVSYLIENVCSETYSFSTKDVLAAILQLSVGLGFDGLHTYHSRCMNSLTMIYLKRLFNYCLIHSYLPQPILNGL